MADFLSLGGPEAVLEEAQRRDFVRNLLDSWGSPPSRVLLLPPDFTRFNSGAGELTAFFYEALAPAVQVDIMPALGTHVPMTEAEIRTMFGPGIPLDRFLVHDWRRGIVDRGEIPAARIREWSEGKLDYSVRVEVSRVLFAGYDRIVSIGQVVPHEVAGMANYTKNLCIGAGGADLINKSHFLGAVYGMERIMGRADTPVRRLLNHAAEKHLGELPVTYLLTVLQRDPSSRRMVMRGLFAGEGQEAFLEAAALSRRVNLDLLDRPLDKVVVYLDPEEFKSTWLGNKAVYRTRMAIADGGELWVLAPGLKEFGEDPEIDRLIRKYGYRGTPATLDAVARHEEMRANLSAAAHLIHGSSEGRFRIVYCPGPGMTAEEIRGVGFEYGDLGRAMERYAPDRLRDGWNELPDGERVFFISHPGLGLWALESQFAAGGEG